MLQQQQRQQQHVKNREWFLRATAAKVNTHPDTHTHKKKNKNVHWNDTENTFLPEPLLLLDGGFSSETFLVRYIPFLLFSLLHGDNKQHPHFKTAMPPFIFGNNKKLENFWRCPKKNKEEEEEAAAPVSIIFPSVAASICLLHLGWWPPPSLPGMKKKMRLWKKSLSYTNILFLQEKRKRWRKKYQSAWRLKSNDNKMPNS